MAPPVFISYARTASAAHAQALAARLGDLAFLDTSAIDDGDDFPQRLIGGVLDARTVVLFATRTYSERRFCRVEMRLALSGGDYWSLPTHYPQHPAQVALKRLGQECSQKYYYFLISDCRRHSWKSV